ncbi:MAG TPA: hypothetical protein VFW23_15270 [Tepidisphaeraceae bacterium]|nr:hypothetical protein [Tepidisphaeraceae bacterium]
MKNGFPNFASGLHRRVLAILLGLFALYWPPYSFVRADAIDDFRAQYPAAEAGLRRAYSQVQITGRHLRYARPGVVAGNVSIQDSRQGDAILEVATTVLEAGSSTLPGTVSVFGGSANEWFNLLKKPNSQKFRLISQRPNKLLEKNLPISMPGLVSAYCTATSGPVLHYLSDPQSQIISVAPFQLDGRDLVEVVIEQHLRGTNLERHLFFEPQSWALGGWTEDLGKYISQGRVEYEPASDPPKIHAIYEWIELPRRPEVKTSENEWDFTSITFGPQPAAKFTVAGYAVENPKPKPALIDTSNVSHWSIALIVAIFVLALLVTVRKISAARRGAGSAPSQK